MSHIQFHDCESLNYDNVPQVFAKSKAWILQHPALDLVLDFSLVQFIDSAGIAMLVELRKLAQLQYQKILVLNISPVIQQMIAFYDLENLLDVVR